MNTQGNYIPVGPLTDETLYIERNADGELLRQVKSMEYVMILEPRQQGKTSLIRHLMITSFLPEWSFAYIDISTLDTRSERNWYQSLCRRISLDLKVSLKVPPDIPQNSVEWRDYLSEIAIHARQVNKKIVIILDEIGGAKFDNNNQFFTLLRELYSTRKVQIDSEFQNLTFILVGSFNPQDLIQDQAISPFNVVQQIHIPDFTWVQVQELMQKRGWEKKQAQILSERIHYWTNGQPYLSQLLCSYLDNNALSSDVDKIIERLRYEDINNLPHLIAQLNTNHELMEYVRDLLAGKRKPFNPIVDSLQYQLFLAGWINADENGYCSIRNRIYKQTAVELLKSSTNSSQNSIPHLE